MSYTSVGDNRRHFKKERILYIFSESNPGAMFCVLPQWCISEKLIKLRECKDVIDVFTYSPVAPTNPGPLLSPDINTARLVAVGGRDAVQQPLLIDVGALLTILFEVRSSIGPLQMDTARRRELFKQIGAIEDFAQRPKPHQGTLLGLVTRLAPMLKMARAVEATEIVEDFLKRRTGVR